MDPLIFVIFGASGDLNQRKLMPAIFQLYKTGNLPGHFAVLGVSRTDYSDEAFRQEFFFDNQHVKKDDIEEEGLRSFYELNGFRLEKEVQGAGGVEWLLAEGV